MWVSGAQSLGPHEGVWIILLVTYLWPFFLWWLQPKVTTVVTNCLGIKFSLGFWEHSRQQRKKNKKKFFLSSDLLPSSKSEKLQNCIWFFSTRKKLECYQRAVHPTDTNKQCQQERKPLDFKRMLSEQRNQACPRNGPPELPLTHRMWNFFKPVIYIQTQVFLFFVNMHSVCDLSTKFWVFLVFPTKLMFTLQRLYSFLPHVIKCNPSHEHSSVT